MKKFVGFTYLHYSYFGEGFILFFFISLTFLHFLSSKLQLLEKSVLYLSQCKLHSR